MGVGVSGWSRAGAKLSLLTHSRFPLFTAVYKVCYESQPVGEFIRCLQNHPEHM